MTSKLQQTANRKNAQSSTGPKSLIGKRNVRLNALKHGLYAQNLIIRPEHEREIETLQKGLHAQLLPKTAMQKIAFKAVVYCAWQCELAARLDMRALNAALFPPVEQEPPVTDRRPIMETWFAASPQALRDGNRFLECLRTEVLNRREVPEAWKDSVRKGFGQRFLDLLEQPKSPISLDALQLAIHLVQHARTFDKPLPVYPREGIVDPQQSLQSTLNMIDLMREFLDDLKQVENLKAHDSVRIRASDTPPRHFADATRALRRAVEIVSKPRRK